jgi:transposase
LMPRPRMPRCAAWCGGIPARITRRCCGAWPRRAASKRRVPRIRFDRTRKGKTLSNADWASPPDARIARMKDGTTHLAYKPEHAVDLDTGVIVAIHPADQGDTHTLAATLEQAMLDLVGLAPTPETPAEMIADKGYHSREGLIPFRKNYVRRNPGRPKRCRPPMATLQFRIGMKALEDSAWKSRISEKEQKAFARWQGDDAARRAVYNNRARLKSTVARQAFKLRAEKVERSFAFILDIGGLRRTWLRGTGNVEKRYLIQVAAHNLGLVIRHRFGAGTPRQAMAVLWFISPESCQVILATGAIHSPLEVADHDTIPPWKVVAFDCLIISI